PTLAPEDAGPTMRPTPSQHVWTRLAPRQRDTVIESIIRVLTEVVENERLVQDPVGPPAASSRGLPAAVHAQASPERLRERPQPAGAARTPAGVGLAHGSNGAHR